MLQSILKWVDSVLSTVYKNDGWLPAMAVGASILAAIVGGWWLFGDQILLLLDVGN